MGGADEENAVDRRNRDDKLEGTRGIGKMRRKRKVCTVLPSHHGLALTSHQECGNKRGRERERPCRHPKSTALTQPFDELPSTLSVSLAFSARSLQYTTAKDGNHSLPRAGKPGTHLFHHPLREFALIKWQSGAKACGSCALLNAEHNRGNFLLGTMAEAQYTSLVSTPKVLCGALYVGWQGDQPPPLVFVTLRGICCLCCCASSTR